MNRTDATQDLIRADIRALEARIYEPQPRIWSESGWECPQCKEVNLAKLLQCACGISRDGLSEFCQRSEEAGGAGLFQLLRSSTACPHPSDMNPGVALFANRSLAFSLYEFNLAGVSAKELAASYSLPSHWVEERIEAVRLCLKYQVKLSVRESRER